MAVDDFDIVPTRLAVKAMRDNGYRNAGYAIAELIDNSIQAKATTVELLCAEEEIQLSQRRRRRIRHIAVLDNGEGMDLAGLRRALQFGNGARLNDRTGMGRFGMGLPSASISQCKRVDVWSWQSGVESALYTYLDLTKIEKSQQHEVPLPQPHAVPEMWRSAGKNFSTSGTLVVWSELDRIMWKTAAAIIDNSEYVVGRMYRRFLQGGKVEIRLASFLVNDPDKVEARPAVPNDPGYMMVPSSTPAPYDTEAMFQAYGEKWEVPFVIFFNGTEHTVTVRFTFAKEKARQGELAGSTPHGKHAAKNVGVSILRAGRELELDQAWVIQYDPRERWWGVEVEFPPSLDELFGVANNKQSARNFSELGKLDMKHLLRDGVTIGQLKEEMLEEDDPAGPLLEIAHKIHKTLGPLREAIKAQKARQSRGGKRHGKTPEDQATEKTRELQDEGKKGTSDAGEQMPPNVREGEQETDLKEAGVEPAEAKELAARTVSSGVKYSFVDVQLEGRVFFSVKPSGGVILIKLNTLHPAYKHLVEVLEQETEDATPEALRERLESAGKGLKLLLMAWARYEDELEGKEKMRLQDIRTEWGRYAAHFLDDDD